MTIKIQDHSIELNTASSSADILKNISEQEFLGLGVQSVAYIRPVDIDGETQYAIHAADGTPLSVMDSFDIAVGTILQNDLSAVTVH